DKNLQPTVFSFRYALWACSSVKGSDDLTGSWRRCLSLLDTMDRVGIAPDRLCYRHAVDAAAKAGEVDRALELVDRMEACGGYGDASAYNQVIVALGRKGDWQRAVSTLGRIRRAGAAPDAHSFAMAMAACARGGEPRQALRLLDELKREGRGVRPNTVVYNTLLGLCKGKPLRDGRGAGKAATAEGRSGVGLGTGVE
ncbi:unnamed protein product, partial [Laminaria digitata]